MQKASEPFRVPIARPVIGKSAGKSGMLTGTTQEDELVKDSTTTQKLQRLVTAATVAVVFSCSVARAQHVPPVPPDIKVPAGNTVFLKSSAIGTQNYICLPSGWTFLGPQATLFITFPWIGGEIRQQIATHFLSPNRAESGTARPTWQSSLDTSAAWAKSIASSNDSAFVAPGAIPWLLLQVVGAQRGPTGGASLSQTTYLQRVNTSGGVMPTSACTVGSITFVPYTADYFFYKAAR